VLRLYGPALALSLIDNPASRPPNTLYHPRRTHHTRRDKLGGDPHTAHRPSCEYPISHICATGATVRARTSRCDSRPPPSLLSCPISSSPARTQPDRPSPTPSRPPIAHEHCARHRDRAPHSGGRVGPGRSASESVSETMALVPPPANDRKRVKVYELKNNDWFDRGTGFCRGLVVSVRLFAPPREMQPAVARCHGGLRLSHCARLTCATTGRGSEDCRPLRRRPDATAARDAHIQG
jgi:hypothetical protein